VKFSLDFLLKMLNVIFELLIQDVEPSLTYSLFVIVVPSSSFDFFCILYFLIIQ